MSEVAQITPAMIAEYQRQQEIAEEERRRALIVDLQRLAQERGYQIAAAPHIDDNGRLVARWGVLPL